MVLTKEENEFFTRVGPGMPAGELLRRYWHPFAVAEELTDEQPTRFVRLLGEDLVLFKDRSGNVGLVGDHCPHRGASLLYGRVEERGIACAYHGWLFNTEGNCLETPAEPAGSMFHLTVRHKAYPVKHYVGLYWAYMGPLPAPEIPPYDLWARADGRRKVIVQPDLDCNWFQAMENSADPAHAHILHQDTRVRDVEANRLPTDSTRGFIDDVTEFDFYEVPYGLMKHRTYANAPKDDHPLIFPNMVRVGTSTQIRVPVDDTHTKIYFVKFEPTGTPPEDDHVAIEYVESYKQPAGVVHPNTRFRMDIVLSQDHMAWETQGPIADRTDERLATSDRGIVLYRDMLKREIAKVHQGLDPMGTIRDPEHDIIDTNLAEALQLPPSTMVSWRANRA
jgi:5,5'-dehydrodivanillate O-demethylase oxygenase subunit